MKWLAIGPGRCGTKSLAAWAASQKATHESVRLDYIESPEVMRRIVQRMAHDQPEISFMWTPHWRIARKFDPDLPIICMHRDKFDTVASHIRICGGKDRLVPGRMKGPFSKAYPQLKDKRDSWLAWGFWWDLCEAEMDEVPGAWHLSMEDLNDENEMLFRTRWLAILLLRAGHRLVRGFGSCRGYGAGGERPVVPPGRASGGGGRVRPQLPGPVDAHPGGPDQDSPE
jgi:hypothetical protein